MKIIVGFLKIALTGLVIGFGLLCVWPLSAGLGNLIGDRQHGLSLVGLPLVEIVKIVPALCLGWTVKRHPLMWGFAAGLFGALIQQRLVSGMNNYEPYTAIGSALALAAITSVSCLAGQALRQRFCAA